MRNFVYAAALALLFSLVPLASQGGPLKVHSPESVGMSSERLDRMTAYFQGLLDKEKSGGYQLLVSRRGKVVMFDSLGMANVDEKRPISDDTLFRIFSMTKPVMGVAMMMLYEEGYFSLNDPVSRYLPELAGLKVYTGEDSDGNVFTENPDREPTIHDLLQHTAGFTYGIFGDTAVDKMYRNSDLVNFENTKDRNLEILSDIPLLYQPGSKWVYSISVDIQGYLIEKLTGMTVGEFLQERLFDPLGMDETLVWVPENKRDLLADVYTHGEDGKRVLLEGSMASNALSEPGVFNGGGQLISTSDDYWRFGQMLLNGGEFDGKRYLSPRTIEMMTTNRLPANIEYPPGQGFGLNFGVITDASLVEYAASNGEYGWGGLASTVYWADPEEEMVVIFMTQYLPYDGAFYRDVLHSLVRAAIIE